MLAVKPSCPLCRATLTPGDLYEPPPPEVEESGAAAGAAGAAAAARRNAKIEALLQRLRAARDAGVKSVIFSQFTGAPARSSAVPDTPATLLRYAT